MKGFLKEWGAVLFLFFLATVSVAAWVVVNTVSPNVHYEAGVVFIDTPPGTVFVIRYKGSQPVVLTQEQIESMRK